MSGPPRDPAAGVLLSTAASDSEGTLGGLVALGEARHLKRLLDQALEDAARCSTDPLCAEHVPHDPDGHAARGGLPRLPVRLRDQLRDQQPMARPRRTRRHHRGRAGLPVTRSLDLTMIAALSRRLPQADLTRLSDALINGQNGLHRLRSTAGSDVLRAACTELTSAIELGTDARLLAGALLGAAATAVRLRDEVRVDVVWTGPTSSCHDEQAHLRSHRRRSR